MEPLAVTLALFYSKWTKTPFFYT